MASSIFPDPLQLWRDAVTRLEQDVNALATGSLGSQEVSRSLHQFSTVSLGMQQMLEKLIERYLQKANLPSRKEVAELAESLRRIEDKIDRLLPAEATVARPSRTRKPPPVEVPAAETPPVARAAARPARRGARAPRA
jgi:hypothetical protein